MMDIQLIFQEEQNLDLKLEYTLLELMFLLSVLVKVVLIKVSTFKFLWIYFLRSTVGITVILIFHHLLETVAQNLSLIKILEGLCTTLLLMI